MATVLSASSVTCNAIVKNAYVDGQAMKVMLDTGCSVTLVNSASVAKSICRNATLCLKTLNSNDVYTEGSVQFHSMNIDGVDLGPFQAHKVAHLPINVDIVIGLDVILRHGLTICVEDGEVKLNFRPPSKILGSLGQTTASKIDIEEPDFDASFDGQQWTVNWHWKGEPPPTNVNRPNYQVKEEDLSAFDAEITKWITEGILVPWKPQHGEIKNVIPLMSVRQQKGETIKIRPVLDFRFLNEYVKSFPGAATPLCRARLREWRKMGSNCAVVDLQKAYLQISVAPQLWNYQAVRWNGNVYLLTRLGFGLNVAPKAMTKIVERVLDQDDLIGPNTSSYIDDIYIAEGSISAETVVKHLAAYGLKTKPIEWLGQEDGVRLLGLRVNSKFQWTRDHKLPEVKSDGHFTRREVHSILGEWLGHLPVAGWLRVACGFVQRCTAKEKTGWDEYVSGDIMSKMLDIHQKLQVNGDPCKGKWLVNSQGEVVVWTDASSIALGVAITVDGDVIEDAAWLRKENDTSHINVSELDAAIKGINMTVNCGFRKFTLMTDSVTVYRWLNSVIKKTKNVRTHALSELLIRRRLTLFDELCTEENLDICVELVRTHENKADSLTRVPSTWMKNKGNDAANKIMLEGRELGGATIQSEEQTLHNLIKTIHDKTHFGIQRTLELAQEQLGPSVTASSVERVIAECEPCSRICPSVKHRGLKGVLSVSETWHRLSSDITHVGSSLYLTVIDNSSRFCVWRRLANGSAAEVMCGNQSRNVCFGIMLREEITTFHLTN